MKTAIGIVRQGQVKLQGDLQIPEGATVYIAWCDPEEDDAPLNPYDRTEWALEDMLEDMRFATGKRFDP